MRVWLLQTGEPLPLDKGIRKLRTALVADALINRGHSVVWWASAFEHQRKKWIADKNSDYGLSKNYTIRVLRGTGYKKNISIARYLDHISVARKFKLQADNYPKPDAIIASMPCYHLAYNGMQYAQKHRVPFIVDIRDLWPDTFLEPLRRIGIEKLGKIFLWKDFRKLFLLLHKADSILAVSQGFLDWGLKKINRKASKLDKVFYIGYQDVLQKDDEHHTANDKLNLKIRDQKVFLFVGTFGASYELDLILDVAEYFHQNNQNNPLFYIAGSGEQFSSLKKRADGLPNVILPGWIDFVKIRVLLLNAYAGIVPCRSVKNIAPNKVFEYLSAGLPLISSLEGEIADIIDSHKIGLNYKPGDSKGLRRNIEILLNDPSLRNRMSQNAMMFFHSFGNAERIYTDYAKHIENIFEQML